MDISLAAAGPTGLMLAAGLARRGHRVTVVDRDPGPDLDGAWNRRGVMQFEHAHAFRPQVSALLLAEWPAAYDAWEALGAERAAMTREGVGEIAMGTRSRRSTFERALRTAAAGGPGLTVRTGHVDGVLDDGARVRGLLVDGAEVEADLVVDATGRAGRITGHADALGGECGLSYVDRVHRLRPGASPGPMSNPVALVGSHDGYLTLLFLHERGHFSVLFVRPTADEELKDLRHRAAFEAACASVPGIADWTHPARSEPVTEVMVGGALRNVYRPQLGRPGLVAVGDSVATTTPTAGRGIALCAMQVEALLGLLDAGADAVTVAAPFGRWCDEHIQPWVADHIACDDESVLRWQGVELDVEAPLTSTSIADAAQQDPRIMQGLGPYLGMEALPSTLRDYEDLAREIYRTGWRPAYAEGPCREELVAIVQGALAPA
jgi:2-polyprenyl-6-methoxyphenol hydroxylase-like FAD-dependent oxidoreductase